MAKFDDSVTRVEFQALRDELRSHYATKADLERMTRILLFAVIAVGGLVITVLG